jgi:hypothetical protein
MRNKQIDLEWLIKQKVAQDERRRREYEAAMNYLSAGTN